MTATPDLLPSRTSTLTATLTLATLYSTTIETLTRIHPSNPTHWSKPEQLLLTSLGVQQARLLAWGDITGICSPPAWIATHMVPTRPSATNPEPEMAIYFGDRDERLDDAGVVGEVRCALEGILGRGDGEGMEGTGGGTGRSKDEGMTAWGLRPGKKGTPLGAGLVPPTPAVLDTHRLEGFREKFMLLGDLGVASGVVLGNGDGGGGHQNWAVGDLGTFRTFVEMVRGKVDYLVLKMGLLEWVDRAVCVDVRALGWHPSVDSRTAARVVSKLRLVNEACLAEYPEYSLAAQQALDNLNDRWKGHDGYREVMQLLRRDSVQINEPAKAAAKARRPGILKLFRPKSWRKEKPERRQSLGEEDYQTPRSKSTSDTMDVTPWSVSRPTSPVMERVRSKSVSDIPLESVHSRLSNKDNSLARVNTVADDQACEMGKTRTVTSMISRHDQWRG
ncbi:hypothetical protein C1H76_0046 [Elsinoe australis]|uniref:Prion-inhibition and propagation HeLo domain-containing protein n=1 Tax=Elsinoe australis TaxID=40998 RepID=A0A4V6DVB4_9PEZI|nr:hypothetical protein C1H76_0046 [Elsinoe australis]